ncbi:site-specific integrase [Tsukamurella ocularis]
MAGRPPLRIGAHGKITRTQLAPGKWRAYCRYRGTDGVTRPVERRTPDGVDDEYGKAAEDALLDHLQQVGSRNASAITTGTLVPTLLDSYLTRAQTSGDYAPRTIDTYRDGVGILKRVAAGVRVGELDAALAHDLLQGIERDHGAARAKQCKMQLRAIMQDAVLARAIPTNPVNDLPTARKSRRKTKQTRGARPIDGADLPRLLKRVRTSHRCRRWDIADVIVLAAATGARTGELLALRWSDIDLEQAVVTVEGHIYRAKGQGLTWEAGTKAGAGRPLALPAFAVAMLKARREREGAQYGWLFPSAVGTLRDPSNVAGQFRDTRRYLGLADDVTLYSLRKTVATAVDGAGLSARIAADQLGHAKPSMTQNVYMQRNTMHREVADALDRAAAYPQDKRRVTAT